MHPKQSGTVVRAGAGFHAARRKIGNQRQELVAAELGFDECRLAVFIHAMHRKNVLGEINSNDDNAHDFALSGGVDEIEKFHHGTLDAVCDNFAAASGRGSPFHSLNIGGILSKELFSGKINISYGQFYIEQHEEDPVNYADLDEAFEGQQNGLCGAAQASRLFLIVGPQNGAIELKVELCSTEPVIDHDASDIVQCSFSNKGSNLHIVEWADEAHYPLDLPEGKFYARYSIQGMDKEHASDCSDEEFEKPIAGQNYKIQFWKSDLAGDQVIKSESELGRYWHGERKDV